MNFAKKRLVVGMSGSSGAEIGIELLKVMQHFTDWETHLVISEGARRTIEHETKYSAAEVEALASKVHALENVGASIASGSFKAEGMVVVPCSMKTVAGIANGFSHNLLLRAADVTIKERRRLVLVARETPLSSIHLRNMLTLSDMGVTIMPPMLTFYNHPETIQDMVRHIVGKITDVFGIEMSGYKRWEG
ncbi:UbiX family flavin prenyltransferase [Paenibacillus pinistramenti]|uniref:UbiX family flavin prenyltransferase n=1 Tax=Paenibacillus pinistramenti TaxID=1768003 RepID=UPI0011088DFC|nr:UbiX family flavin prenyltransferase [Paenibacillus pinistramenti]